MASWIPCGEKTAWQNKDPTLGTGIAENRILKSILDEFGVSSFGYPISCFVALRVLDNDHPDRYSGC